MIEDNGNELSDQTLSFINQNMLEMDRPDNTKEITALYNIYRRISIYSENKSTFTVGRSKLGGMQVTISLCL